LIQFQRGLGGAKSRKKYACFAVGRQRCCSDMNWFASTNPMSETSNGVKSIFDANSVSKSTWTIASASRFSIG
jgi:hypothetical protein